MEGDVQSGAGACQGKNISIHSLRMEGDVGNIPPYGYDRKISIHSLRMEGDRYRFRRGGGKKYFNPLPPHGGRHLRRVQATVTWYFNPLPPHGGRPSIWLMETLQ